MKIKQFIASVFCTALFTVSGYHIHAQQVNAAFAEFDPEAFPGYPYSGTFLATFGKTPGTVPAGTAQVIFTMVPEVPWNGKPITTPTGWTLAENSTPTNIRFVLSSDWNDQSEQDPAWIIPVTSIKSRSDESLAVTSQIQQSDGDWSISAPISRTSITVKDNPLPVNLTSFTARKEGLSALLNWTTTEETRSDRFDIEHSLNGKNWEKIGSVKSAGESKILQKYSFVDEEPSHGENLYRLKMVDHPTDRNDGAFGYSRIQSLVFDSIQDKSMVFPNPTSDLIKMNVKDLSNLKSVKIYDLKGRTVYSAAGNNLSKSIDVKSFVTGVYIVELAHNDGLVKTSKIVISR